MEGQLGAAAAGGEAPHRGAVQLAVGARRQTRQHDAVLAHAIQRGPALSGGDKCRVLHAGQCRKTCQHDAVLAHAVQRGPAISGGDRCRNPACLDSAASHQAKPASILGKCLIISVAQAAINLPSRHFQQPSRREIVGGNIVWIRLWGRRTQSIAASPPPAPRPVQQQRPRKAAPACTHNIRIWPFLRHLVVSLVRCDCDVRMVPGTTGGMACIE